MPLEAMLLAFAAVIGLGIVIVRIVRREIQHDDYPHEWGDEP